MKALVYDQYTDDDDFSKDWEEGADDFEVQETALYLYNEGNEDETN